MLSVNYIAITIFGSSVIAPGLVPLVTFPLAQRIYPYNFSCYMLQWLRLHYASGSGFWFWTAQWVNSQKLEAQLSDNTGYAAKYGWDVCFQESSTVGVYVNYQVIISFEVLPCFTLGTNSLYREEVFCAWAPSPYYRASCFDGKKLWLVRKVKCDMSNYEYHSAQRPAERGESPDNLLRIW